MASTTAMQPSGIASMAPRVELGEDQLSGVARSSRAGTNRSVNTGATFDLNGHNETIAGLNGGGVVTNNAASTTSTVTVGFGGANGVFSGALQNGAGTTALSKTGSGTLTLSGLNTYSGATVINDGTVRLQGVQTAAPTNGLSYRLDASDASKLTLNGSNVAVWADSTATGANFPSPQPPM